MTILNASECQQAWNDLGLQTSIQDLETLFNQAGYTNDLNSIASNLEFQGGGFDSNGTALLTFKMTHWSEFLKKMHKLTGDATWMTRAEGLIDWFFDRTDAALWATDSAGHQNLPITGGGALIPYTQCAGLPLGWDVNTPWCGWSRIFTVNLSGTDTTFVRAEPLLDGGIANAILCQIKHMRECGVGASEAKVQSWLVKLECILSGWKANWEEGRSITINPDCNPSGTTVSLAGQFYLSSDQCGQTFADPIALNQAATMLSSMVLLNECDSSMCPDAKAMSALFIQDINNFYFNSAGGWYYRIGSCASFEPAEDMGHFYITAKFITTAFECGLVDQVFVDRFINGLKTNSYQSNGDWTWLNDGSYVTQGTQPNGSNTNGQGYASGPTDSAIGGASQLGKTIAAIAGLPGTSGCIPELSLTAQLLEGQGNLNNNEALEGLACLYVDACTREIAAEPCLSCTNSTIPTNTIITSGDTLFLDFTLVDEAGNLITTTPTVSPTTYVGAKSLRGNGDWQIGFNIPNAGTYNYTISDGCNSCPFTITVRDEVIVTCTTATTTVIVTGTDPAIPSEDNCITGGWDEAPCIGPTGNDNVIEPVPHFNPKVCNGNQCDCYDEPHQPAIMHCNVCISPGATFTTAPNTVDGTHPSYTCECEDGLDWRFVGTPVIG